MSGNTLVTKIAGDVIAEDDVNQYKEALGNDHLPRDTDGIPTAEGGSLGSAIYPWLRLFILVGGWQVGDIKMHHSFNGAAAIGHGWMLCDGRQVTKTAYETEHGAATWDTLIGTSDLLNKYLPNFTNKFPVGVAATTQAGTIAITSVGNASHQINLQHTHAISTHNHKWYGSGGTGSLDISYDTGGSTQNMNTITTGPGKKGIAGTDGLSGTNLGINSSTSYYTDNQALSPANSLSTTQSIKPESIEVQFYLRII